MRESIDLKTLQRELQKALKLINDHSAIHNDTSKNEVDIDGLNNTQSLLERCAALVDKDNADTKPTLRIIHHFACSGGTLISKCLAAQPNVFLLSELHPTTRLGMNIDKANYTPRDVTTQAIYGRVPSVDNLAEKIFVNNIIELEKHIRQRGGYLVIRAHTHSDYCTNKITPEVDTLTRVLEPYFKINNLVTVRNPIDSFMSLRSNGWVHFNPDSFDEYCKRLLRFLSCFDENKIVRYENFVEKPFQELIQCAQQLSLPVTDQSLEYLDIFKISGDSGRSGMDIVPRPRKKISNDFEKEVHQSKFFQELCYNYHFQAISKES